MTYQNIQVETRGPVALITLSRPKAFNALSDELMDELTHALDAVEAGDGRQVQAWDGRETAPAAADDRLFLGPDGKPLGFHAAAVGGRSVGAPGVLRMLAQAHAQHGRLAWARLYEPAIRLADAGFPVGARLHGLLGQEQHLRLDAAAARHFYQPDGKPLPVGTTLRNPALAAVFRQLARDGAEAFYGGPIAASIVAKVQQHPTNPGRLTERDLADYRPQLREALVIGPRPDMNPKGRLPLCTCTIEA